MNRKLKVFIILDVLLLVLPLTGTIYCIKEICDDLSFVGFMGLFFMIPFILSFAALIIASILFLSFLKWQKTVLAAVAFVLQLLSTLPLVMLMLLSLPASFSSMSWYEYSILAQMIAGIVGLLILFIQKHSAKARNIPAMNKPLKAFSILDILLLVLPLAGTVYYIKDIYDRLVSATSDYWGEVAIYGGLFVIGRLILCLGIMTAALILLLPFLKWKRTSLAVASFALQILSPVLWFTFILRYPFGALSWYGYTMLIPTVSGIVGLLILFIQQHSAKEKANKE